MTTSQRTPVSILIQAFRGALTSLCSELLGSDCTVTDTEPAAKPAEAVAFASFVFRFTGTLHGGMELRLRQADALFLAQTLLSAPRESQVEITQEEKDAILQLLQRLSGLITHAIEGLWKDVNIEVQPSDDATWKGMTFAWRVMKPSLCDLLLATTLNSELVACFTRPDANSQTSTPNGKGPVAPMDNPNLGLLGAINLKLNLRFGKTVMPLRDILELNTGSVIELNSRVSDPADLMLGDKVVARGEVVIVDGNYGIRVIEVTNGSHN